MNKIIGNVQILDHDIHYGYEGGYYVNFIISSREEITKEQARERLLKHFNPKPIEQLKKEWEPFMPEGYFDEDLTFDKHSKYAYPDILNLEM